MITLAIDASTKSTGWSIFEDQELKDYGCITASSSNLFNRIHKMIDEIDKIIIKHKVEQIAIEDVIPEDVHHNTKVFNALMYLQGFLADKCNDYKITPVFYVASAWRKKCGIHTGRGIRRESLKPKDIQFVKSQFGINVNDDEADAICIGFAHVGGVIKEPQEIVDEYGGFEFR